MAPTGRDEKEGYYEFKNDFLSFALKFGDFFSSKIDCQTLNWPKRATSDSN